MGQSHAHKSGVVPAWLSSSAALTVRERGFDIITRMIKSTGKLLNEETERLWLLNLKMHCARVKKYKMV